MRARGRRWRERGGIEVAIGGADSAGGNGEGVRGESEGADEEGDADGAIGVRTCEANVGESEGGGGKSREIEGEGH